MALLLAFLTLLLRLVSAAYEITCANTSAPSTLDVVSRPLVSVVQFFIHDNCSLSDKFDDNVLWVATWPTYANVTSENSVTVHLTGYAFGAPTCANDPLSKLYYYSRLLGWTGHEINDTIEDIRYNVMQWNPDFQPTMPFFPADYLSWSIHGAGLTFSTSDSQPRALQTSTGRFGHFQAFENVEVHQQYDRPTLFRSHLKLTGCDSVYETPARTSQHYIVPPKGLTIVSDVDDILRIAEVWNFTAALSRLLVEPFRPRGNMNHVFNHWADEMPKTHFHYVSDAPETTYEYYVRGLGHHYPPGSYDFRPIDFGSWTKVVSPRYWNVRRLIESFPERRYVLIGDTATTSTLTAYGRLEKEYPDQVQCIIMRNVDATEPGNWILPNLKVLPADKLLLFNVSSELNGMTGVLADIEAGKVTGCGGMETGLPGGKIYGLESGILSAWKGFRQYVGCSLHGHRRPNWVHCRPDRPWKM
ncbi:hypothetical protein LTR85_010676 [Meristemomyces frigidus]|nr:hypothetical protein LTR85_010676 [Meristemomyces frigidus]